LRGVHARGGVEVNLTWAGGQGDPCCVPRPPGGAGADRKVI